MAYWPQGTVRLTLKDPPQLPPEQSPGPGGRYEVLEVLGEGGMGTVYLAQQHEPVRREVALKVIKAGMDTRQVLARFEAERQALARMEHTNIAKVFDGGAFTDGRPYFAMEVVRGVPITKHCDRHQLPIAARLDLFLDVCHAVQHAHQKGILHRDLKPSNVLVADVQGRPTPKIIDFGLAKALYSASVDETALTETGYVVGTPRYMSPEQISSGSGVADTRSDIYSLGVLLYLLLTGVHPLDISDLATPGLVELGLRLLQCEPEKPSARVASLGGHAVPLARNRATTPRALCRQLRGDLDWITMKSLEREPMRRYASASELARDILRWKTDEPVIAGPPDLLYRTKKLVRRHRTAAVACLATLGVLIVSVPALAWLYLRAETNRQAAELEAERAEASRAFLEQILWPGDAQSRHAEIRLVDLLDKAATEVDAAPPERAKVEADVRETIGTAYRFLGLYERAEHHLAKALELYEREVGMDSDQALQVKERRALIQENRGDYAQAGVSLREVYEARRARLGDSDPRTLGSAQALAINLGLQGKATEREQVVREALAASLSAPGTGRRWAGRFQLLLADICRDRGDYAEAESLYREAVRIGREVESTGEQIRRRHILANFHLSTGRVEEAEQVLREILPLAVVRYGERHPRALAVRSSLARCSYERGQPDLAASLFREILAAHREALGEDHPYTLRSALGLARALAAMRRHGEAETILSSALAHGRNARGGDRTTVLLLEQLGAVLLETARSEEALEVLRQALGVVHDAAFEGAQETALVEARYGAALLEAGLPEEAEPYLLSALRVLGQRLPDDHRSVRGVLQQLVAVQEQKGDLDRAEEYRGRLSGVEPADTATANRQRRQR